MKLHEIVLGIVFISVIFTGVISFYSGGNNAYSPGDYNNSSIQVFNQLDAIYETVNETKAELSDIEGKTGIDDLLGSFFSGAYKAGQIVTKSFDLFFRMIRGGVKAIPLIGSFGNVLIDSLSAAIIIAIFIGVIMAFATKSDRT